MWGAGAPGVSLHFWRFLLAGFDAEGGEREVRRSRSLLLLCFEGFRCHILQPTARISLRHNYTTHMTLATLTLTRSVARVVRARTATASERRSPLAPTSDATLLISGPLAKPLCPHHLSLTRCHRQRRRRYGRGLIAAAARFRCALLAMRCGRPVPAHPSHIACCHAVASLPGSLASSHRSPAPP